MPDQNDSRGAHLAADHRDCLMSPVQARAVLAANDPAFRTLRATERRTLQAWARKAHVCGIDAVQDLGNRSWHCPPADSIIGVFRSGRVLADWLVIGQDGRWLVADTADGTLSAAVDSLDQALALICPKAARVSRA